MLFCAHAPVFKLQIPLQVEQASPHRGGGFSQVVFPEHLYLVMTRPTSTMNIPAKRIPVIGTNIAGSQAAA